MNIKPINGQVVIQPIEESETVGGIILTPEKQKTDKALVIAVFEGSVVSEGQEVLYKKWSGQEFTMDKNQYIMIDEQDLLAIVS